MLAVRPATSPALEPQANGRRGQSVVVASSHQDGRQPGRASSQFPVDGDQLTVRVVGADHQRLISILPGLLDEFVGHVTEPAPEGVEPSHSHVRGIDVTGELVVQGQVVDRTLTGGEFASHVVSLELHRRADDLPQVAHQINKPLRRGNVAVCARPVVPERGVFAHDPVQILAGGVSACSDER